MTKTKTEGIDHKYWFAEFCRLEKLTQGPDPWLAFLGETLKGVSFPENAWRAGCLLTPYCIATGAILWNEFPLEKVKNSDLQPWINNNWPRLMFRRERRAARSRVKLAECLLSLATWVKEKAPNLQNNDNPEILWDSVNNNIKYFGRYISIKYLECLNRFCGFKAPLQDIRPRDAWSPRLTLSWLYPEHTELLVNGGNAPEALILVNKIVEKLLDDTESALKFRMCKYDIEVMLCNYRQALAGRYPGRTHDTELGQYYKMKNWWGEDLDKALNFFEVREVVVPQRCRGELHGWDKVREELGETFEKYGYFWCDMEFDYKSTVFLASPVRYD